MKMDFRKAHKLSMYICVAAAVVFFIGCWLEMQALLFVGLGIIVIAFILSLVYYRCPHCGAYLGRSKQTCKSCGQRLDW